MSANGLTCQREGYTRKKQHPEISRHCISKKQQEKWQNGNGTSPEIDNCGSRNEIKLPNIGQIWHHQPYHIGIKEIRPGKS
ncbi:hypothetical protein COLO4_14567 [Corchorus olitorius]|uniref:Uncharacterized protein n=1 Tax=Corchorus olitorius TaxID=93759 RepID=A0A1R3JRS6_9ROSI|nr:hypothetical protein COLO4_14567 [Corchorus olitorius]